jgi:FKBP-type peptidyl-prolyl cis-trans isomerase SlyD
MAINENQVVSIEYQVNDTSTKEVIDSNVGGTPLTFLIGKGQIIPGLEEHIKGMSQGESSDALIKAGDAYGEYNDEAIQTLPKEQFAGIELQEGMTLYGQDEQGGTVEVAVKSFDGDTVTIDFNHPLAGKDLLFSVTVTMVRDASADEIMTGELVENMQASSCCSTDTGSSCGCH